MVKVEPLWIGDYSVVSIEIHLPKTNLLILQTEAGYVMCGALDVQLLREKLADRRVVAARAVGVKTMDELLNATVESCTQTAEEIGIYPGMPIRDAVVTMIEKAPTIVQ
ncbi:hypothetical protein GCM10025857_07890 [Alicyclobacillus contaminans]|uniref:YunC family protein n=1 Tax=Alicyclobacillus contaminans TaxID=392016 RepID=UPI000407AA61|nr:DUF1805 domain-containing protein [Alicyclobacillus contaminans]GMA49432.1 hypothetical protein GCM10025857_07890 [Alicyclobacillus contaminans]